MQLYGLFAVTTALVAIFQLFVPSIKSLDSEHNIRQNIFVACFTFFTFSLLLAPVIFFAVIMPSAKERFIEAMSGAFEN